MVFNSISFAIFFAILFILYWFIPHKYRWGILLLANIYFYLSFDLKYLIVLVINILISYLFGILLQKTKSKVWLVISIILCLSSLLICKYANFTIQILQDIGIPLSTTMVNIILPVGISFYTFEIISYLVDVYKGKMDAEKNIAYYAIYVSFFGTIPSGPIERARTFIPQIKKEKVFNYCDSTRALKTLTWGLFKKIVIADNLALYVNAVFNDVVYYKGFALIIASALYAIQIYCDFSGYSDMARGFAKLLGFDINPNFNVPYLSTTIKEFWSRWHISLTGWLIEYIYIPLGGNRKGKLRKYINILIVFLVSGLWHGANYTFIVWGLIHAFLEIFEDILSIKPYTKKNPIRYLRMLLVFILVTIAWIFFRSNTISDALYIFKNAFSGISNIKEYLVSGLYSFGIKPLTFIIQVILYLIPLVIIDSIKLNNDVIEIINTKNIFLRYSLYLVLVIVIVLFHNVGEVSFIYFKF